MTFAFIMAATLAASALAAQPGNVAPLAPLAAFRTGHKRRSRSQYGLTSNRTARPAAQQIQVVLNWFEDLKARVPTK